MMYFDDTFCVNKKCKLAKICERSLEYTDEVYKKHDRIIQSCFEPINGKCKYYIERI